MKKLLYLFSLLLLTASCSHEKPYTIQGSIELPDSLMVGDTLMATPSLEGWQVYMLDLDGVTIDSTLIEDNKFVFEGTVDERDPYYVYMATDLCVGLIAVEPGNINIVIDTESLTATGTPTNDLMIDLDAALLNLQQDTYVQMAELTEAYGEEMNDSIMLPLYQEYISKYAQVVDSFCQNASEFAEVYCVNVLTSNAQSSADLIEAVSDYSDYVKNAPLIQSRINYLRSIEAYYQMLDGTGADSTMFSLEDLMRDAEVSTSSDN